MNRAGSNRCQVWKESRARERIGIWLLQPVLLPAVLGRQLDILSRICNWWCSGCQGGGHQPSCACSKHPKKAGSSGSLLCNKGASSPGR